MFEKPRYIQNSFNITFRSQVEIQNKTDEFEKLEISEEQRRELIRTTKGRYKSVLSSTEEFIDRKRQEIQVE
jgi:hypothetical protein